MATTQGEKRKYNASFGPALGEGGVSYNTEDRQWDIRLNIPNDEYIQEVVEKIMLEWINGKFKYILVGGIEIGDREGQGDYGIKHVHAAVIFHNRASKASIIKNWGIKEGYGYYMVPRDRTKSYSGWRDHHTKTKTKVNINELQLLEYGELPTDKEVKQYTLRSETEKKMNTDDIIRAIKILLQEGKDDVAFEMYPRNFVMYGEKIKTLIKQKTRQFFGKFNNPHIYLTGYPGSGKTSLIKYIYPDAYKKQLDNRFWDLFDPDVHTHTVLEDLDPKNVEKLGIQFLKTICDEGGFPVDAKYKTPQVARTTVLITSNYTLEELIRAQEHIDVEKTLHALARRFYVLRVDMLHRLVGVKLIPKYERTKLQKSGNEDYSKLYIGWNYILDCPTGEDIKTPTQMQDIIRDTYYQ